MNIIAELARKITTHLSACMETALKQGYVECSAEGHVSHALSHRLSTRPLSWSKKGSETIGKLRVYTRNDGSMPALLIGNKEQPRMPGKADAGHEDVEGEEAGLRGVLRKHHHSRHGKTNQQVQAA